MALPLCLDRLVNVAVALVLSTTAIVLFGEAAAAVFGFLGEYVAGAARLCSGDELTVDGCSSVGRPQRRMHASAVGSRSQGRAKTCSTHLRCSDTLLSPAAANLSPTFVRAGEILPQAVCSRYGLSIGGHAAPVVRLLMWLTAPISWPIGKGLDWLLGKEQPVFGKRQISALVDLHRCARVAATHWARGGVLLNLSTACWGWRRVVCKSHAGADIAREAWLALLLGDQQVGRPASHGAQCNTCISDLVVCCVCVCVQGVCGHGGTFE
jgi:hypothetical protein